MQSSPNVKSFSPTVLRRSVVISPRLKVFRVLFVLVGYAFFAVAMSAQTQGSGVLNTSGGVTVNQKTVTETTPVYTGDLVETKDGNAAIATPGSSLTIPSRSEVLYQGKIVELKDGAVTVSTKTGMPTQALKVHISPRKSVTTRYEAVIRCYEVTVHAFVSDLVVSDGDKTYQMSEGETRRFKDLHGHDSLGCEAPALFGGAAIAAWDSYFLATVGGPVSPSSPK